MQCSNAPNAEKYVIATDAWVSAGRTPATLPQPCPGFAAEIGPAVLLPDGRVFAIGATGATALYSPGTQPAQPGSWSAGPTFFDGSGNTLFPMDAPACLLPSGKVLCAASPAPPCKYPGPTLFFEYDPATNTLNRVADPRNAKKGVFTGRMLLLPTGEVLFANGTNDLQIYLPDLTEKPQPGWAPVITAVPQFVARGRTSTLSGTQLNGLSQAVSYGDDAAMATNYPIVWVRNLDSGDIFFCRTFNHSTMGVATGSQVVSTTFQVPSEAEPGLAEIVVIANGIRSDPVQVTVGDQVLRPESSYRRNFLQGTWGNQGNFELLVPQGSLIRHYYRDNDDPQLAWHLLGDHVLSYQRPPGELSPRPRSVTFLQSTYKGDGVHGNFEAIVRVAPAVVFEPDFLDFWFLDSRTSRWNGPFGLLADGEPVTGATGDPVLIQSSYGSTGNFELLVPQGNTVGHYFRDNDDPQMNWHLANRGIAYPSASTDTGPVRGISFIQSNFIGDGLHGNFEAIVRVAPDSGTGADHLDFWFFDSKARKWNGPFPVIADGQAIEGVTGDPVLIQSTWGRMGNFELLVPQGDVVRHYFRDNDDPQLPWHLLGDRMISYALSTTTLGPTPRNIAFIQSNFMSDGVHGNFEAIVQVAPALNVEPDHLDFWFLASNVGKWNGPFALTADGIPVTGVTGS